MHDELVSDGELHNFLNHYKMKDGQTSVFNFNATVSFEFEKRDFIEVCTKVTITTHGIWDLGRIYFEKLDAYLFPEPTAKRDKFSFVLGVGLLVEGEHTKNANIGKYKITIIPD